MSKLLPGFPNDNWTRVEIFIRAWGRCPTKMSDVIDQKTLDKFCERFEALELETQTVDLYEVYKAIKSGKVEIDICQQGGKDVKGK